MAVRPCFFIVRDDGSFYRVRKDNYYRILDSRDEQIHPEFKGQRIKFAEIYVKYDGRRPLAVRGANFHQLTFDRTGRLDAKEQDAFDDLFVQFWPDPTNSGNPEAEQARIAAIRAEKHHLFGWQPTPELRLQLYEAALSNKLSGGTPH